MDILSLAKAISEFGITIIICVFFLFLVVKLQKQDEKNDAKLEEAHRVNREQGDKFMQMMNDSQDKYLKSMQEVTGRMTKVEFKLDNISEEMKDLRKEVRRGER